MKKTVIVFCLCVLCVNIFAQEEYFHSPDNRYDCVTISLFADLEQRINTDSVERRLHVSRSAAIPSPLDYWDRFYLSS